MKSKVKKKSKVSAGAAMTGSKRPKTKFIYVKRVMPVAKIYKLHYPYIFAYEDGLQICKFESENQRSFDNVVFVLKALAYKEDRT